MPGPFGTSPKSMEGFDVPPVIQAMGGLDISGFLQYGFADIRRKVGHNTVGMFGYMLTNILEHVHLRRRLVDTYSEVVALEKTLKAQAVAFGTRLDTIRPHPPWPTREGAASPGASSSASIVPNGALGGGPGEKNNEWLHPSGPTLTAGSLDASLGAFDLTSVRGLALNSCSPHRVQEFRLLLQSEVAYKNLLLMCVQMNALMMDPGTRHKDLEPAPR